MTLQWGTQWQLLEAEGTYLCNLTLMMAVMTYFAQNSVIGSSFPQCGQTTYYLF
jgi:hypothetical protein